MSLHSPFQVTLNLTMLIFFFNITVIQVYAPTSNTKEAEVEWFYEVLQD